MTSDSKTSTTSDDVTPESGQPETKADVATETASDQRSESPAADSASADANSADANSADTAGTAADSAGTDADSAASTGTDADSAYTDANTDADGTDGAGQAPAVAQSGSSGAASGGFAAGAIAIVSAVLGLVSITGSSLGDMLRFRKEIMGQIELRSGGGGGDQVEIAYGAPWDTVAIVNGAFALLAVVLGGALLAVHAKSADAKSWVKAAAFGGALLGVIGLGIAGGMYLDLFGSQPELPQTPQMPGAGG